MPSEMIGTGPVHVLNLALDKQNNHYCLHFLQYIVLKGGLHPVKDLQFVKRRLTSSEWITALFDIWYNDT